MLLLHQRAKAVFLAALEQPPAQRRAFVAEACGADEALKREAESLLDFHDEEPPAERGFAAGEVFAGRYEVESLVGRGGMGTVWKVRDRMVGETVALKTLHVSHDNERAIERFRREVRLARRITSPHVARTHDLGTTWRMLLSGQPWVTRVVVL